MKTARILAILVVGLFLLSCYNYIVFHVAKGGKNLGIFTQTFQEFSTFPRHILPTLNHVFSSQKSPSYLEIPSDFTPTDFTNSALPYPLMGLMSFWNTEKESWVVRLLDLQEHSVEKEWVLYGEHYLPTPSFIYNTLTPYTKSFEESRPLHSLLAQDSTLIVSFHESANLLKLDAQSQLEWKNSDFIFHHSMNFDADSNIWICASPHLQKEQGTYVGRQVKDLRGITYHYRDDLIVQVELETGQVLFQKSLSDILLENQLRHLLFGVILGPDPLHLNDIEPSLDSTQYWEKGDLFLSLRHRSLIIQYRPSTNRVIRVLQGSFLFQHDIDIWGDGKLSIFNNNTFEAESQTQASFEKEANPLYNHSEVLLYDLADNSVTKLCDSILSAHGVATASEGLHEILDNGDILVESQNQGRILIINEKEVVWEKIFLTEDMQHMNLLNWLRIINPNSLSSEP